ncbi:response regulator [Chryseobacterium polytrichastri]|uniref:CheY chemotaxis protein or a CheY-like REC (Receiver) domain n=1 Tax=Chryseobacterium polytrichastri TaxID=1302687 RepID=A0A1M6WFE2_9FLAO|nr:response regulator [Chryseobacterium polytrichastri]SHK92235.1 CheY chemotaxis protein or a CheY-like REC (receiver) domain [Chryseobacterium polytrichastri]
MNREYLSVILVDDDEGNRIVFKKILKELKIGVKIQSFCNGENLMEYLNSQEALVPEILFMNYNISMKNSLECLLEIKTDFRFDNMVTAVYSEDLSEDEIENIFINGANVFIKKREDYTAMKKVLSEVITLNWQYYTSGLNRDNFIMKV